MLASETKEDISSIKETHLPKLKEGQDHINKQHKKMTDEMWKFNEQLYNLDKHSREV